MITKTKLIYHFYIGSISDVSENYFYSLNQRILSKFCEHFDSVLFCVVVDNVYDSELINCAVKWITDAGPWKNLEIKIKQNTPFYDAQTFFDEIIDKIDTFNEIVMFGHNKGTLRTHEQKKENVARWVSYAYYSILRNFEKNVKLLLDCTLVTGYVPTIGTKVPVDISALNTYGWHAPGGITMFNPMKLREYVKNKGIKMPSLSDRYSNEMFWGNIIDIKNPDTLFFVSFDSILNVYFVAPEFYPYNLDHFELIKTMFDYYGNGDEADDYENFYKSIK